MRRSTNSSYACASVISRVWIGRLAVLVMTLFSLPARADEVLLDFMDVPNNVFSAAIKV